MGEFQSVKVGNKNISPIDWEMSPELTFGTYESWGGRERVRNNNEKVYYFFIDSWGEEPKLRLMERAVKHAKIVATIDAPENIIKDCVNSQGRYALFERSFAIDEKIKKWLINNVLDGGDASLVHPTIEEVKKEDMGPKLPTRESFGGEVKAVELPTEEVIITDEQIGSLLKEHNFFDNEHNPNGSFKNGLVESGGGLTVTDLSTGLEWQRGGLDISSIRQMNKNIDELNKRGFAGHNDWRMPTMEEAMSLMEKDQNNKGVHLHPCFSKEQPFIFVAAQRKPGGYWFVDYKQGRAFWSSGTIPGGFGRLVRTAG